MLSQHTILNIINRLRVQFWRISKSLHQMIERMNAFHFSITATLAYIHLSVLLSRIIIFLFKLFQMQTTTYIDTINQHKLSKVRSNLDCTFKILSLCLIYNTFKKYRASTTMKLSIVFITIAVVILYIEESIM